MVASLKKFDGKVQHSFCLNIAKRFFVEVLLKTKLKSISSLKDSTPIFQNSFPFKRSASFYMTITRNLEGFLTFGFKITFLKKEKKISKTGVPFLVESTTIDIVPI